MKQYITIFVILAACVAVSALMWNVPVQIPTPDAPQNPPTVVDPAPVNPISPARISPTEPRKCYAGGCSGQICSDDPNAVSTCEWTEAYACYQGATCEVQPTGECGWTETSQLTTCLNTAT